MNLKPEEISSVIKEEIKRYSSHMSVAEVGTVIQVADGIARIHGLEKAMQGELLEFPHGVRGMVLNLEEDNVGAVLLGDATNIEEGDIVKTDGKNLYTMYNNRMEIVNIEKQNMEQAKYNLRNFSRELNDVNMACNLHIDTGNFLSFADYFFDGFVVDWMVQERINNAKRQVEEAIRRTESIVNQLQRM